MQESDTPIQRHVKIKADANPHDPQWEPYFETRWGKKMLHSPRGRATLYRVWQRQEGLCSACLTAITKDTPWGARHIVKKREGGTAAASNLTLHHLNCRRHHSYPENAVV